MYLVYTVIMYGEYCYKRKLEFPHAGYLHIHVVIARFIELLYVCSRFKLLRH